MLGTEGLHSLPECAKGQVKPRMTGQRLPMLTLHYPSTKGANNVETKTLISQSKNPPS